MTMGITIFCCSAGISAALHDSYNTGIEREYTITKCLSEFHQDIDPYPFYASRTVNNHCLIGNGLGENIRIKTTDNTLATPPRLLLTTIVSKTWIKTETT